MSTGGWQPAELAEPAGRVGTVLTADAVTKQFAKGDEAIVALREFTVTIAEGCQLFRGMCQNVQLWGVLFAVRFCRRRPIRCGVDEHRDPGVSIRARPDP
jgi:hypothetical protein